MNKKSNIKITVLFVLSVSLIVAAMTTYLLTLYYRHVCFHILGEFCDSMIENNPNSRQAVLELLKTQDFHMTDKNILSNFGYYPSNLGFTGTTALWIAVFVFLAGGILFLFTFCYWHRKSDDRIQALTEYLGKINTGIQGLVLESSDDEFSKLQDEIYKTVTELYQTREEALTARNNYAENLSNIAHQLKTPITSISLTIQMAKEHLRNARTAEIPQGHTSMACKIHAYIKDIERQMNRLMYLEEALLLLSRIDAGTLVFDRKPTDVFTILSLASDNLCELSMQKGVLIDVPEMGEMNINVDLNWTTKRS